MVLENATATITTIVPQAVGGEVDNYVYLFIILGGVLGTFLALVIPFYRAKRKFGKEGIDLLFDKDFLKTAGFALVVSVISIGALYPTLLAGADVSGTYFSIFLAAATLAFTLNVGGSWMIGSNNKEAEEQLVAKKAETLALKNQLKSTTSSYLPSSTGTTTIGGDNVTQPPQ